MSAGGIKAASVDEKCGGSGFGRVRGSGGHGFARLEYLARCMIALLSC